jgi:hypothetical protein
MKYLLLIYGNESSAGQAELEECYEDSTKIAHELAQAGKLISVAPLQNTMTARTVRIQNSKAIVTDGPFAETHEQLGGYFLVDVPTFDEAIAIAHRLPGLKMGSVEVRPLVDLPNL